MKLALLVWKNVRELIERGESKEAILAVANHNIESMTKLVAAKDAKDVQIAREDDPAN